MKKLLSLLSVLTISGTAVPTTIAASPYQKEENIKNSDINYQQTNNLENLNRNKRQNWGDLSNFSITIRHDDFKNQNLFAVNQGFDIGYISGSQGRKGIIPEFVGAISGVVGVVSTVCGVGIYKNLNGADPTKCPNSKEISIENFVLNTNLKTIDDDNDNIILSEFKKLNPKLNIENLYIAEKTGVSCKIIASNSSLYKSNSYINVNYFIKRDLQNTSLLLNNWLDNFKAWKKEIERQKKEDLPNYGSDQRGQSLKRTWIGNKKNELRDKIHSLSQDVNIVINNIYIKKLYSRIQSLESDLTNLKIRIDDLEKKSPLSLCGSSAGFISTTSSIVPVIGDIVSYISGLISASCFLTNEFN